MTTTRQADLLQTPRWQWLRQCVATWYAEPVTAGDGSAPEEIAAAEERVGPLPAVLREWFELVGARLRGVQDCPSVPANLCASGNGLVVWSENQGNWTIQARPGVDWIWADDPECFGEDPFEEGNDFGPIRLSTALQAMTLSDTLVAVWGQMSGHVDGGPLGRLGDQVRGGVLVHGDLDLDAAYPPLPLPSPPGWSGSPCGDATTFLRKDEWMTATDEAFAKLATHIDLDPPGGEHLVSLTLPSAPIEPMPALTRCGASAGLVGPSWIPIDASAEAWDPVMQTVEQTVSGLGRFSLCEIGGDRAWFQITTPAPDAVVAALLAAIPEQILGHAEISTQPIRVCPPRIVHPAA